MTEKQWAEFIGINEDCYKIIKENKSDRYNEFKDLFYNNNEKLGKYYELLNPKEILSYYFYLSYEFVFEYNIKDPNNEIIKSGCNNIWLWAEFNLHKNGYYGIEPKFAWWINNILTGKVYRLGRLEFEDFQLEFDVQCFGKMFPTGTRVVNTHIPATGSLDYEECLKSYKRAVKFYNNNIFMCESWLLAPCLEEMVSENSNINKFRKDWTLFKMLPDDRLFEERIFDGNIYDDPNKYIVNTTLQKKAKERLLAGKKLPSAYGLFVYEG